jgi:hypothetical protein
MIQRCSIILLGVGALALQACGDLELVESRYPALADARADHAVERGYLPSWVPEGTRDIRTIGDLDTGWFAISFIVPQPDNFPSILEANGFRSVPGETPTPPASIRSWEPAPDAVQGLTYRGTHYHNSEPVVLILAPASGVVWYWRE